MRHFDNAFTEPGHEHRQGRHGQRWEGTRGRPHGGHGPGPGGRGDWAGHRGGRGGRGGRPHVGKGDVRAAILLLLDEGPLHGYQLIHRIEERSGGLWRPSPGSVYPALQQLEDEGLVSPEQEEGRRVLHLTDSGRIYVATNRAELEEARDAVVGRMNPRSQPLRDLVHQIRVAVDQVTDVGTPAQLDAAQEALIATRRQLYRILADDLPATEGTDTTTTRGGDTDI